jgi:uncharacterized membrane protein
MNLSVLIPIVALIGFLLSLYAFYIERRVANNAAYRAICDLSETVNCTRVLKSKEGHVLGVSNALIGLLFYTLIFGLSFYRQFTLIFWLAILSVIGSTYLAYVSYIKMRNVCLVCTGIYVINILLLVASYAIMA